MLSILLIIKTSKASHSTWQLTDVDIGAPYWVLSTGLSILVTSLIVGRLLYLKRSIQSEFSLPDKKLFDWIASILVESAALYAVVGLVFIVTYLRRSPAVNVIMPVLAQAQVRALSVLRTLD